MILFGLLQVTQVAVNKTKVIVARCHIKMVRVELFQMDGKCTFMIPFGLLQVTQGAVNSTNASSLMGKSNTRVERQYKMADPGKT